MEKPYSKITIRILSLVPIKKFGLRFLKSIRYIKSISDKFKNINGSISRVAFYSTNKLSRFIKVQKDSLPKSSNMSIVYKNNCKDCDASYVGQTDRQLKTRISEYKNLINRNTSALSVITEHRLYKNHDFN